MFRVLFYDALTLAAVRDELAKSVLGGRVQRVFCVSEHALGCEIYANGERHWLLASAHPQNARVHLVPEKLARGSDAVTPLLLLLRKYVRDGRLASLEQPHLERILMLGFIKRLEDSETIQQTKLIIEVMGRHSNIILAAEREPGELTVLESQRHITSQLSRYRVILPQHPYVSPPPQAKTAPESIGASALRQLAQEQPATPLWQGLVASVSGMSPLLAREITFRALSDAQVACDAVADGEAAARVIAELQGLYAAANNHAWSPSVARADAKIVAFAPYMLTHLGDVQPCASISEAIASYYSELEEISPTGMRRDQLHARVAALRERRVRRKNSLQRSLTQGQEADQLRLAGETILSAIGSITPKQTLLDVDGRAIKLDPDLSAVENARAYFQEYKKAKAALAQVPEMLAVEDSAIAYLDEVSAQLDLAESIQDLRRVAADLEAAGLTGATAEQQQKARPKAKAKRPVARKSAAERRNLPPPYRVLPGGFEVYLGRSARDNETVTFGVAGQDDLWLHARGVPGAHVVVKAGGRPVPEEVIVQAAKLAALFSRAKDARRIAVDCTQRKHVRRVRAGLPGLVTYSNERTIDVRLG